MGRGDTCHQAGITPETGAEAILVSGTQATLNAYRALVAAIPTLTEVCALRVKLATVGGVGVAGIPAVNIMGGISDRNQTEGRQNIYGHAEGIVSVQAGHSGGHDADVPAQRFGAGWLDLAVNGCVVKNNTADGDNAIANLR